MRYALAAAFLALLPASALAEPVTYEVEGETFNGYFAAADAPKGLVLILHDWDGMTDYEATRADMLAAMGYDAFALDMFGEGTPTGTVEHRRAATGALYRDRARMRMLIKAGLAEARRLSSAEEVVAAGYCFGGAVALEMARNGLAEDAVGYATFHGGLTTPEGQSWPADTPPLLIAHGGADTSVTLSDAMTLAGELEAAGATYTLEVYSGAPHAFTVLGASRYQERADEESWAAFSDFLAERFGG